MDLHLMHILYIVLFLSVGVIDLQGNIRKTFVTWDPLYDGFQNGIIWDSRVSWISEEIYVILIELALTECWGMAFACYIFKLDPFQNICSNLACARLNWTEIYFQFPFAIISTRVNRKVIPTKPQVIQYDPIAGTYARNKCVSVL